VAQAEKRFRGKQYGEFKRAVAEAVVTHLAPFRARKIALMKKPATLKKMLAAGSAQAAKVANAKIAEVKKKVGLMP
jgi:tryptophanyl-tRNA synthetase